MSDNSLANTKFIVKIDIEKFNSVIKDQILEENIEKSSKENKFAYLDKELAGIKQDLSGVLKVDNIKSGVNNDINNEIKNLRNTIGKNEDFKTQEKNDQSIHPSKPSQKTRG